MIKDFFKGGGGGSKKGGLFEKEVDKYPQRTMELFKDVAVGTLFLHHTSSMWF